MSQNIYLSTLASACSVLYASSNIKNDYNNAVLNFSARQVEKSSNTKNALSQYKKFFKENHYYYDFLIIDSDFEYALLDRILEINPKQNIIINVKLDSKNKKQWHKAKYFMHEPLKTSILTRLFSKILQLSNKNSLLARYLRENERSLNKTLNKFTYYEDKIEEMEHKLKSQADFFASMSHEIRTPMNAIIGMSQILIDDESLSKKQSTTVNTINNSSNMLLGIINDILDFSKIEANMLTLESISFDLNMIFDYVADMIGLKVQEKNIDLIFDINHNVDKKFLGDPLRVSQILLNLVSNAVKFTDKGSILLQVKTLKSNQNETYLQFEVRDTGIGIKKERLDSLFENYTQANDETSRKYGGTGLGLAICKQLASIMDGDIWAESDYGHGTSFFVTLKLEKELNVSQRQYRLPSKDLMHKKILIVDSRIKSINALKYMLEYFKMQVSFTLTIKEARKKLATEEFDILIIDELMFNELGSEKENISKIVLLEDWMRSLQKNENNYLPGLSYLKRPFNQLMLFNTILELYGYDTPANKEAEKVYKKDDLKNLPSCKIIVAEDNKINQAVIKGLLLDTPIEIFYANDGEEVLNELYNSKNSYKLILMDINMPNVDGIAATSDIRKYKKYDDLMIVALSGDISKEDIEQTKLVGMQEHLAKPIDIQEFYKVLISVLS